MVRLKVFTKAESPTYVHSFQFLMVRLKVVISVVYLNSIFISIPYGAIKSRKMHLTMQGVNDFNSLWCD